MSDQNNQPEPVGIPDSFVPEEALIELDPENELKFVENDGGSSSNGGSPVHSTSHTFGLSQALFSMKNVSKVAVLFKIQTTSPVNYRVKPSHGRIEPGEVKDAHITMLTESKKMDKFLINLVPTFQPIDSALDFNAQFALVPDSFIQRYRLRCVFPNSSTGLLAASASIGAISSPVAPSLKTAAVKNTSMESMNQASSSSSINSSPSTTNTLSISALQRELKDARAELELLKSSSPSKKDLISKEWKNVLSGQYGAPPVLVLLVAIFAFMLGLLF